MPNNLCVLCRFTLGGFFFSLVFLLGCGESQDNPDPYAPKATSTVKGVVQDDSTEEVISGATVFLGTVSAITDESGQYSLEDLESGDYLLIAIKDGYQDYHKKVTVVRSDNVLNVKMHFLSKFRVGDPQGAITEAGGTATFTMKLNVKPSSQVTVPVSSSNLSEGIVSPDQLVFTVDNWNSNQVVTVTGIDDVVDDGDQVFRIILGKCVSEDLTFNNWDPKDVLLTNSDDDTPGFILSSISGSTSETGTKATFTVKLSSQPTSEVTLPLASGDETEGALSPLSLTFTLDNWNAEQIVSVIGLNDLIVDGDKVYSVAIGPAISSDSGYDGLDPEDMSVTNKSADPTPGVTISALSGSTFETGEIASFTMALNTEPQAEVTFPVSSDTLTEGTVAPASLTFTALNWKVPQMITIKGVADDEVDGDKIFKVVIGASTSTDSFYNTLDPADVPVTNRDMTAGFIVGKPSGNTTETGGTATFTIRLSNKTTTNVIVDVASDDSTEGSVFPSKLAFHADDWDVDQVVKVTGKNDHIDDGNLEYHISISSTSSDYRYNGLVHKGLNVINEDDDIAGFYVGKLDGNTSEDGGSASFTVKLRTEPTADVTFDFSTYETDEIRISPERVIFTTVNWNTAQNITVTGIGDDIQDGDQSFTVLLSVASDDPKYDKRTPPGVDGLNFDRDSAGVTVSELSGSTTEAGETATFTVKLTSKPIADVNIDLNVSDSSEGSVSPSILNFTSENWNLEHTVTVTGLDDNDKDGDQLYLVNFSSIESEDTNYAGWKIESMVVLNVDDEL
ncbi:carboxypeptidase regulatory-like domain-containing protein [Deltaproteobacteria bacterium TL4]